MFRTIFMMAALAAGLLPLAACNKESAQAFSDRTVAPLADPLTNFSHARITTSMGEVTVSLHWDAAPRTCLNFAKLAEKKFYDGILFHRVIPDFMVQTGDPQGTGSGGPGYKFEDEIDADALGLDKLAANSAQYYMRDMQAAFMKRANAMGVNSQEEATARQDEMKKLQEEIMAMNVKRVLQEAGYTFTKGLPSKKAVRGALAMANAGPDTNGSQFFINVGDTPHLDGKHTVFGTVVKGMDIVDAISKVERGEQDRPKKDVKIVSVTLLSNF